MPRLPGQPGTVPLLRRLQCLLRDGADFQAVDKVMERWGWPMGPAYLMDVVGIDTGVHAGQVMAEGFPDRMQPDFKTPLRVMFEMSAMARRTARAFTST